MTMILVPFPRFVGPTPDTPFFSGSECSVEEAGAEFDAPSLFHVEGKCFKTLNYETPISPIFHIQ
jgi:hypothetical protein